MIKRKKKNKNIYINNATKRGTIEERANELGSIDRTYGGSTRSEGAARRNSKHVRKGSKDFVVLPLNRRSRKSLVCAENRLLRAWFTYIVSSHFSFLFSSAPLLSRFNWCRDKCNVCANATRRLYQGGRATLASIENVRICTNYEAPRNRIFFSNFREPNIHDRYTRRVFWDRR